MSKSQLFTVLQLNNCYKIAPILWNYKDGVIVQYNLFVKPVKRFQMKSNGCRNVQHTGLQTRRNYSSNNTGKQGAQTRGTRHIFPSIPTSMAARTACQTAKQFFQLFHHFQVRHFSNAIEQSSATIELGQHQREDLTVFRCVEFTTR